ncbi:MAG: helix-turn-helix transcriptional regulator [Cyclobacteriaceae bacterium]
MTRDLIELNDFSIMIEESNSSETVEETCGFQDEVIGFAFYGSGNVDLTVRYGDQSKAFQNTKGIALSFYGNKTVDFVHLVSPERPLQCVLIFSTIENLKRLPEHEDEVFTSHLYDLINPKENFVPGPGFFMTPDMLAAVDKIFNTQYEGTMRKMFLRSQITELLAHFLATVSSQGSQAEVKDQDKLFQAKEILSNNMSSPPSLNELAKLIGLNDYKLKKSFKELFGVPVFKFLQNERLAKAYDLLKTGDMTIQEAAWSVGYESLSSFSSAFQDKFGYRPSEVKK